MDAAVELLLRRGGLFWDFGMMCVDYLLKTRPIANRIYEGRHGHYDKVLEMARAQIVYLQNT